MMLCKRIVTVMMITVMVCLPICAMAQSFDDMLQSFTDDELLALKAALDEEMAARGLATQADKVTRSTRTIGAALVWVPKSGSKYHTSSTCSNMSNPSQVTVDVAIELGYTPCNRCH